ncbi:hypothetical protein JK628_23085 (plasmid) [Shewanella sp. KX20019]|uniref:hypothetical protein n=1 Tax=Shewanella sp. KX20019 TaxID=2803864 RepID=UPI001926A879|nr:hypothetical protein [Shewanella sp. KX20019]QQX82699.1 hypothetical protein JK628_23085 [Shewanella sp. KX20019]
MFLTYETNYDLLKLNKKVKFLLKANKLELNERNFLKMSLEFASKKSDYAAALIANEEYVFQCTGRNIIFPESNELIKSIMESRFDISEGFNISFPFNSFVIAMPRDSYIKPLLVSFIDKETRAEQVNKLGFNEDAAILSVLYRDDKNDVIKSVLKKNDVPKILDSKNFYDFQEKYTTANIQDSKLKSCEHMFNAVKFACSLMIYHSACGGMMEGFPEWDRVRFPKHSKKIDYSGHVIVDTISNDDCLDVVNVKPHFRNLKDPRFYTGIYSDIEPGSRWTLVSEHTKTRR